MLRLADLEQSKIGGDLNSAVYIVYKIDYSAVDGKPEVRFIYLKRLVGPSRRFSNFSARDGLVFLF